MPCYDRGIKETNYCFEDQVEEHDRIEINQLYKEIAVDVPFELNSLYSTVRMAGTHLNESGKKERYQSILHI